MMFLSLGIVCWVVGCKLLHWCDSNAVFIVNVSKVYANSLPQKISRNKIKAYTYCISVLHEQKDKNVLEIGCQHYKPSPNSNIFVINTNHLRNF